MTQNPYASPQSMPSGLQNSGDAFARPVIPFESGHTRAMWAMVLLGISLVANLVQLSESAKFADTFTVARSGRARAVTVQETRQTNHGRQLRNSAASVLSLCTAVAFLMWVHRVHRNLPALGVRRLRFTPAWAVGWYFIPFFNLVRPYQVMKEAWNASHPATPRGASHLATAPGLALVSWWWAMFLLPSVMGLCWGFYVALHRGVVDPRNIVYAIIASHVSRMVDAILAILLVRRIDQHQQIVYTLLADANFPDLSFESQEDAR